MKVGIIGVGAVGSATAFALVMRGVADEVVLIDSNQKKAEAEALDISHATTFAFASKVYAGNYTDLQNAQVVIITAGANQKPGETPGAGSSQTLPCHIRPCVLPLSRRAGRCADRHLLYRKPR